MKFCFLSYLRPILKKGAIASAMVFIGMSSASASPISVDNVTASSTFYTYNVNNLINGSGLSGGLHSGDWTKKWMTDGAVTGTLLFDFGSIFNVSTVSIWNYGTGCCGDGRSVKDLTIEQSTDGINFSTLGDFVLAQPTTDPFGADVLSLNASARYIRFDLNSNYGDGYTGLSEVQFNGESGSVPEPTTSALLGLGLTALVLRRRKQA